MASKRKGLGTGLDALLSSEARRKPASVTASGEKNDNGFRELAIDLIDRGAMQPRVDMRDEALQELAAPEVMNTARPASAARSRGSKDLMRRQLAVTFTAMTSSHSFGSRCPRGGKRPRMPALATNMSSFFQRS